VYRYTMRWMTCAGQQCRRAGGGFGGRGLHSYTGWSTFRLGVISLRGNRLVHSEDFSDKNGSG